jgi:hypothetical protein
MLSKLKKRTPSSFWLTAAMCFEREALPQALRNERISDLALDKQGWLWVAGSDGLARHGTAGWQCFGRTEGLASQNLIYLASSRQDDSLWLAYADRRDEIAQLSTDAANPARLLQVITPRRPPDVDVALIGEDTQGRLWVGGGLGLDMPQAPRAPGGAAAIHFGVEHGLVDEEANARAFLAEPDGSVWPSRQSRSACRGSACSRWPTAASTLPSSAAATARWT